MEKSKWLRLYMNCKRCDAPFVCKYRTICEHCKEAYYCSSECCYTDKISHKNDCKGLGPEASKTFTNGPDFSKVRSRKTWVIQKISKNSEEPILFCLQCDKKCVEKEQLTCYKCRSVYYCSEDCVGIDQPKHSLRCVLGKTWVIQKISKNSEEPILFCLQCDKKCVEKEQLTCYKCRSVYYCSEDCVGIDQPKHSLRCGTVALFHYVEDSLFYGQTYQILKKKGLCDSIDIRPFIDNIHHELAPALFNLVSERSVIILQIVGPYPQSWQYAILVRDVLGKTVHIIFYHDEKTEASMTGGPNLEPYVVDTVPLSSCLKPGNFIILLDPWFHLFKDLTTGIRIDSLEKVHFVWKD